MIRHRGIRRRTTRTEKAKRRLPLLIAAAAALTLALAGCASGQGGNGLGGPAAPASTSSTPDASKLSGALTVAAAASLKGAFDDAVGQFTKAHPGVDVTVSYDGSSTLATQILGGAPVDVFASADEANMAKVTGQNLAKDPVIFARNTLTIIVPPGNPAGVHGLADLARPGLAVVLCAPQVPCGTASRTLLDEAGVKVTPASNEQNVTAVLTKVRNGEADAGLVYVTDAETGGVDTVPTAGSDAVVNSYPIAVLTDAPHPAVARAFTAFVTGPDGQKILSSFGFLKP